MVSSLVKLLLQEKGNGEHDDANFKSSFYPNIEYEELSIVLVLGGFGAMFFKTLSFVNSLM